MIIEILMPRLSETSQTGTVVEWLAEAGDRVNKGQPLVRVESDKATLELEAPQAGTLLHVFFPGQATVQAATVLGLLGDPNDEIPAIDPLHHLKQEAPARAPNSTLERESPRRRGATASATSLEARRRARGIDSARVAGGSAAPTAEIRPLSTIRKLTGERLLDSVRNAPHAFVEVEADVTELAAWRQALIEAATPSYTALFVQAVGLALKVFPHLNASFSPEGIRIWPEINVGVAVAHDDELIVPILRRADDRSLAEITQFLLGYGPEHSGGLRPEDASGGTFTISNLGMVGADSVLSILSPGQAGILSLGRIRPKPAVLGGEIVVRSFLRMTLGFDHRVLDGAMGARFLAHLEGMLAQPQAWAR